MLPGELCLPEERRNSRLPPLAPNLCQGDRRHPSLPSNPLPQAACAPAVPAPAPGRISSDPAVSPRILKAPCALALVARKAGSSWKISGGRPASQGQWGRPVAFPAQCLSQGTAAGFG